MKILYSNRADKPSGAYKLLKKLLGNRFKLPLTDPRGTLLKWELAKIRDHEAEVRRQRSEGGRQ
jgi:hypothetical protein